MSNNETLAEGGGMMKNLENAGIPITPEQAYESLHAYFNQPGTPPPDDPNHVYGHVFGLDRLRELLTNIDRYNKEHPEQQLEGVRIYYGFDSRRDDPDFPSKLKDVKFRDLFFMPVFKNGEDLYPIRGKEFKPAVLRGDSIPLDLLGGSRPCPNQCG